MRDGRDGQPVADHPLPLAPVNANYACLCDLARFGAVSLLFRPRKDREIIDVFENVRCICSVLLYDLSVFFNMF